MIVETSQASIWALLFELRYPILIIIFLIILAVILRDINRRKRTEERLRESEDYSKALFNSLGTGVLVIDHQTHKIIDANPSALKIIGRNRDEALDNICHDSVCPKEKGECPVTDLKQPVELMEDTLCDINGRQIPILKSIVPVMRKGKEYLVESFVDLTERKEAEEALRRTQEQLRQSQKMEAIGRLAGGVAHDFNNLLTVITVCSEVMLEEISKDAPIRRDIEAIKNAGEQATMLIKQLLSFSAKQLLEPKVLDINAVTTNMNKMLRRLVGEDIQVVTILDPEIASIKADRGSMEQVIMNLVVNARDVLPNGGKITIKTEEVTLDEKDTIGIPETKSGKFVCLSVTDTGIGMDKDIMEHIFEPFFTTKNTGNHTGLGLSTVYGVVKNHGGWINVYSEPRKGCTFKIYLPIFSGSLEEESYPPEETVSLEKLQGNGERILLVEDDKAVSSVTERLLTENGYVVFLAETAEEALTIFDREEGNFRLIFSDVVLPNKSGVELVNQLIANKPELPVILSSGYADEKSLRSVISQKGYPFIEKPYTIQKLLQSIRNTIKQRK